MYVRITTGSFDPAKEPELQQLIDEKFIPLVQQLPGFHRYLGAVDRVAGRFVSITVWNNQEQAQAAPPPMSGLHGELVAASLRPDPAQLFELTREV